MAKLFKQLPRYEALLDTDRCSARVNADLTLTMRIGFRQINPAGGADAGLYNDYGDAAELTRRIVKWTPRTWARWKVNFCNTAQRFWDGRFWIDNRRGAFALRTGREVIVPNAHCRFRLIGGDEGTAVQHHVVEVVRLAADEPWFGTHATLYDSRDAALESVGSDSRGRPIMQRTNVHEIGHLLDLGHVAIGQPGCPTAGDTNAEACYGVTDADMNSVMGLGMRVDPVHGAAWLDAFEQLVANQPNTPAYTPPSDKVKPAAVVTQRIYPRTVAEFEAGTLLTALPPGR